MTRRACSAVQMVTARRPPASLVSVAIFGVLPSTVFVVWMLAPVRRQLPNHLTPAMWLAGSWILLSPALIVTWETRFERLMCAIDHSPREEGWDLQRIARQVARMDRLYRPLTWTFGAAVATGYILNNAFLRAAMGGGRVGSADYFAGLCVVTLLGYSFGVGIWGVAKTLGVAHTAIQETIRWHPFRPGRVRALAVFEAFSYLTGVLFSFGAVFLPGTYLILVDLDVSGRIIGGIITGSLILGSTLSFIYPTVRLFAVARAQKDDALAVFSLILEDLQQEFLNGTPDPGSEARLQGLLALRAAVAKERSTPPVQWLAARTLSLSGLPVLVTAIQALISLS